MDSTLNTFIPHFVVALQSAGYGFDIEAYDSHGTWEIQDFIHTTENKKKVMAKILKDISFWENIPPMPNASLVLQEINQNHEVIIATVPWGTSLEMRKVKIEWLYKYFPFINPSQVSFHPDKGELEGDVIFEDKPDTIRQCDKKMITIVSYQPYNRSIDSDFRFTNWNQVPRIMNTITRFYSKKV